VTSCPDQLMYDLANKHPDWGVDTIFQRAGAKVCTDYSNKSTCEKGWRFTNQTLPAACYLQDDKGACYRPFCSRSLYICVCVYLCLAGFSSSVCMSASFSDCVSVPLSATVSLLIGLPSSFSLFASPSYLSFSWQHCAGSRNTVGLGSGLATLCW
jgi:hypothetical protein